MKKLRFLFAILSLFTFSLFLSFGETDAGAYSLNFDWFGNPDRLEKLETLQRILAYIQESYVEPERVNPEEMFKKAMDEISQNVAEVRVIYPQTHNATLVVNNQRKDFNTDLKNLYALHASVSDTLKFVRENRQSDFTDKDLETFAINGILSTLDPHSVYLINDLYNETKVGTTGKFGGLGIVIGVRNTKLTIINVLENTPAFRALLKSGDNITKIGDEPTLNMNLNDAVNKMRGPKGSVVKLSVTREGWTAEKEFSLIRDIINIISVDSHLLPKSVGYVRVKNFQANTSSDLHRHLKDLHKDSGGLKGLILDLRNDPGGLLDQAIGVADTFLADGPIVSTVGAGNHLREVEKATGPGTEPNYPMVVLIDQGSASASEIVAGALKQRDRALVIGQRSFGKGSVQSLFDLPEDSALKLTIAQYLTPGDFSIQSVGIEPDMKLTPSIISKDYIDLFRKKYFEGEVTLEHHLANPTSSKNTNSDIEVHYLEKLDESEEMLMARAAGKQTDEEMLKDFYIRSAFDLLADHPNANKADLLKLAKPYAVEAQKNQELKIAEGLKEKQIDWSSVIQKTKSVCAVPQASWKVSPLKTNQILAGDTVKLLVTLQNPGPCTLYQARASTDSKNYLFNNQEFLFGKILPKQEITREAKIVVPKFMANAVALFQLNFAELNQVVPQSIQGQIEFQPIEKPKFAFTSELNDQNGKFSSGNGNGLIERGESIEMKVRVKNVGAATAEQSIVALKTINDSQINIKFGRYTIPKLKPNEEKTFSFEMDVPSNYLEKQFKVELTLFDPEYRVGLSKRIPMNVYASGTPTPKPQSPQTNFVWNQAPKIVIQPQTTHFIPASNQYLQVLGKISDAQKVKDIYITVNGKKVFYQTFAPRSSTEQKFNTSIPLEFGLNRVSVVARNELELFGQEFFVVQRLTDAPQEKGQLALAKDTLFNDADFAIDPLSP